MMPQRKKGFILLISLFLALCSFTSACAVQPAAVLAQIGDRLDFTLPCTEAGYYNLLTEHGEAEGSGTISLYVNGRFARKVSLDYGKDGVTSIPVYLYAGDNQISLCFKEGDGAVTIGNITPQPRTSPTKMVIVPHEDDELFAFGGSIMHMLEAGDDVIVVIVTNGDFFGVELGPQRILESADALSILGLPQENLIFLGYPDSSLTTLFEAGGTDEVHTFSHGATYTYGNEEANFYDYHTMQTGESASMTGANIRSDFLNLLSVHMPSEIYVTSLYEEHGDHRKCYRFMEEAIRTIQLTSDYGPLVHQGVVHGTIGDGFWPERLIFDEEENLIAVPFTYPFHEGDVPLLWEEATHIELTEDMIETKYLAIGSYYSQNELMKVGGDAYNYAFVKTDEFYWTTDFSK